MTVPDHYELGRHSFRVPMGEPPRTAEAQPIADYQFYDQHRENYRRDVEHLVTPAREWALAGHRSAIDVAQSGLRTSVLINVGAFVAIQAAVPLFGFPIHEIEWPLIGTAVWFALGLVAAWLAHGFGFHAMAHASDSETSTADATTRILLLQYFPNDPKAPAWSTERDKAEKRSKRLRGSFIVLRAIAIGLFWLSIGLFFAGARVGVCTVSHALPPPTHGAQSWPILAICGR